MDFRWHGGCERDRLMKLPAFMLAASLATALAACSDDAVTDQKRLTTNHVVVGIDDFADKVKVNDDSLVFDADVAQQLKPYLDKLDAWAAADDKSAVEPVFLVGNRQSDAKGADGAIKEDSRNPSGYLRRALSWSANGDGTITVKTKHATIAEASSEIFAGRTANIKTSSLGILTDSATDTSASSTSDDSTPKSWSYTFGGDDGLKAIDLSGTTLVEKGGSKLSLSKATLNIKPTIDAELLMSGKTPKSGKAVITTDVTGEIQIDTAAEAGFDVNEGKEIFNKQFAGMFVGGVPVTLRLEVKWQCGIGTGGKVHAMMGAKASGHLVAGAQFEGTSLTPIFPEPTYDLEKTGPSFDASVSVHGGCHLISTLALLIFDAAGPDASLDVYADANATVKDDTSSGSELDTTLKYGVQATVGGQLAPFGYQIAEVHATPLTFEQSYTGSVPVGF
jgi:hypothetical protein